MIIRGATGYAVASTTASSISLGHLAHAAEYDLARSVLFGLSFECAAAITGTAWVAGRRGGWWFTTGRAATLGLLSASLLFNAAEVLQLRGILPPGLLLAVAVLVSAVFPIAALLFAHLALMVKRVTAAAEPAPAAAPPAPVVVRAAPPTAPPPASTTPPDLTDHVLQLAKVERFVLAQRAKGETHGGRRVAAHLGVSRRVADDLLKTVLATLDDPPARSDQRVNGHHLAPTG